MAPNAKSGPAERDGTSLERVGRDRFRFRPDPLTDFAAWLLMIWQRHSAIIDNIDQKGGIGDEKYRYNTVSSAAGRMEMLTELVSLLPDTFSAEDYAVGLEMVGRMVSATDEKGEPVTKLGKSFRRLAGVNDGTAESGG